MPHSSRFKQFPLQKNTETKSQGGVFQGRFEMSDNENVAPLVHCDIVIFDDLL